MSAQVLSYLSITTSKNYAANAFHNQQVKHNLRIKTFLSSEGDSGLLCACLTSFPSYMIS